MKYPRFSLRLCAVVAAVSFALSACGDPTAGRTSATDTITVGSASFAENEILAEIYAQYLEAKDVKVEKKLSIGAREVYIKALRDGEIDLIPEYSGNILTYFDPETDATSSDEVSAALSDAVPDDLAALDPAPAENKDSLNVTAKFAADNDVKSIADLADLDGLKVAGNPEFKTRAYGIRGMKSKYGISDIEFTSISDSGGAATVKALVDGTVDVANIFSTTPAIKDNDFVTLQDPKNMILSQNVVPLINAEKADGEVGELLNKLSAELTTDDLLEMNAQNQGADKTSAATVAKDWLEGKGLI